VESGGLVGLASEVMVRPVAGMRHALRWGLAAATVVHVGVAGCGGADCLEGAAGECTVPPPCARMRGACPDSDPGYVELRVLGDEDVPPGGGDSLAAAGDVMLGNEWIVAVVDAPDHLNFLAPSGGALLDLTVRGADDDAMNHGYQVAGILPDDAFHYDTLEVLSDGPDFVAVQLRGTLDGRPDVPVATRYEVRPCEPWVRIRSELVNLGEDPNVLVVADAFFWGNREAVPFTPVEGEGFEHEPLSLLMLGEQWKPFPFFATMSESTPYISYADVSCDLPALAGVHSTTVTTAGTEPVILNPGEHLVVERAIVALAGADVAAGADMARRVREALFGETTVSVRGVVTDGVNPVGGALARASVVVSGPGAAAPVPLTQIVPAADGTFSALVPRAAGPFSLEVSSFGRAVATAGPLDTPVTPGDAVDFGEVAIPAPAHLAVTVTEGGAPVDALVVVAPANDETRTAVTGHLHGLFLACAPWLGAPFGGSPACNKVIAEDGSAEFDLPAGVYRVYASRGPFATLAMEEVAIGAGETDSVALATVPLDLLPPGTLSGDFHVHGTASFDTSFPDRDRVLSFVAAGVDVIAATDHDVISDYAETVDALGVADQVVVMAGVETTAQIPWLMVPGDLFPHVIGHYNFWPLALLPSAPRNGTPDDELAEPGALFDRMEGTFAGVPVREMNHPWDSPEFGRDLGFFRAVGISLLEEIPPFDDGSHNGYLSPDHRPGGSGGHTNLDFDTEEVINGTNVVTYMQYRLIWFWLLNQGYVRTGVANSDSHTLNDSSLGYGRNLVDAGLGLANFDEDAFDRAVLDGRVVGTNGPVLRVSMSGDDGLEHGPSLTPFRPAAAAALAIELSAAPWIPVEEIRIVVNGEVVRTIGSDEIFHPGNPFGAIPTLRYDSSIALAELLAEAGLAGDDDAWIVVEAGYPLPPSFDANGDGVPDTGDNDGDGVADAADAVSGTDGAGPCLAPPDCFVRPPDPTDPADPLYHAATIVPGLWPSAFTNPLLLDRAGDGWQAPGL
jgi:hypothetical protein